MKKTISIVLPTFNEKTNLEKFVDSILKLRNKLAHYKIEIIISDSNSKDGTGKIAKKLSEKYKNIHHINVGQGLGTGLYKGHSFAMKYIKPDVLVQLDADGQVDEKVIPELIKMIEKGYDLVLGSRFVKRGKNELPFLRKVFSRGSSWVCRVLMGPRDILEFTNSSRAFTPELFGKINWDNIPWSEKTFIMLPAFLNEAVEKGAKYKEVPIIFKYREGGYSKNKIIKYTYDVLMYTADVRLKKMGINIPLFKISRKIF
jgi:dolichol-phosphate mannosyltransferase